MKFRPRSSQSKKPFCTKKKAFCAHREPFNREEKPIVNFVAQCDGPTPKIGRRHNARKEQEKN